jgi:hypothetical protein
MPVTTDPAARDRDRAPARQADRDGTEYTDMHGFTWLTVQLTDSNPAVAVRLDVNQLVDAIGQAASPATRRDIAERLAEW